MKDLILKLLDEGKTYKEISEITGLAKGTISWHAVRAGRKKVIHRPLEDYLVEDSTWKKRRGTQLKKRIFKEGLLEDKCSKCGLSNVWQGSPITLHLDHINGNSCDNRIENLRILCPNCHSQTKTYCRNKPNSD